MICRRKLPSTDAIEISDGNVADTACSKIIGASLADQLQEVSQGQHLTGLGLAENLAVLSIMQGCPDSTVAQCHGNCACSLSWQVSSRSNGAAKPNSGEHVVAWLSASAVLSADAASFTESSVNSCSSVGWSSEFVRREGGSVFTPQVS